MAKVLVGIDYGSYSFNAATSQITLDLNGADAKLEAVLLITNVTDNIIIYNFANPSLGATLSGNILTLDYNTVAMSNTDSLQIWYYNEEPVETHDSSLAMITNTLASNSGMPDATGRLRVLVDTASSLNTVSTVTTVTTVSTVTTLNTLSNITSIGGYVAVPHVPSIMQVPIEMQMQKIVVT